MRTNLRRTARQRDRLVVLIVCLGVVPLGMPAVAIPRHPDDPGLDKQIQLMFGPTTFGEVTQALSAQSGLHIECADYLTERKLTVFLDQLTTRVALDALTELHDLTWRLTEPGHYLVTRRTARRPLKQADIPRAMQAMLPRDLRAYLGLMDNQKQTYLDRYGAMSSIGGHEQSRNGVQQKLAEAITPLLAKNDSVSFSKLSEEVKHRLLYWQFFRYFDHTCDLLYDYPSSYDFDPAQVTLKLEMERLLMVNGRYRRGDPGTFGKNIVDP